MGIHSQLQILQDEGYIYELTKIWIGPLSKTASLNLKTNVCYTSTKCPKIEIQGYIFFLPGPIVALINFWRAHLVQSRKETKNKIFSRKSFCLNPWQIFFFVCRGSNCCPNFIWRVPLMPSHLCVGSATSSTPVKILKKMQK